MGTTSLRGSRKGSTEKEPTGGPSRFLALLFRQMMNVAMRVMIMIPLRTPPMIAGISNLLSSTVELKVVVDGSMVFVLCVNELNGVEGYVLELVRKG